MRRSLCRHGMSHSGTLDPATTHTADVLSAANTVKPGESIPSSLVTKFACGSVIKKLRRRAFSSVADREAAPLSLPRAHH